MAEVVVFPDAAATIIAAIKADFTALGHSTYGVGTRTPTPIPETPFVRIFRTGGLATERVLDQAQLTIEVTAHDTATAHDVAQLVRGLIHSYSGTVKSGIPIYGVHEFSGPQDFPDPLTNKPRYSFSVQVGTRGSAA